MTKFRLNLLESANWIDYELLDSGNGRKLERYGIYIFSRPESQAIWSPALSDSEWKQADAVFISSGEESGGHWDFNRKVEKRWEMGYALTPSPVRAERSESAVEVRTGKEREFKEKIRFWAMTTPGRHLGVFPESAAHWDFSVDRIQKSKRPIHVLDLFGYTGLATLAAAAAGAQVTHVDASKKSVSWARANQELSGLSDRPIRWIVDDALKYVQREARRGVKYDGIILDPPKFGRGPKGEVWEVYKSLPGLLEACRACLRREPLFVVITMYAVRASAVHLAQSLEEMMMDHDGSIEAGELVTREKNANRLLSQATYAR
ncbi:MAG: class I SAM-dependent rRNA methyltransferase [Chloroflexi bacterium]|nr:class I SAM-dependent rRNA methyltransferase [Chloroflexota bacterium]